MMVVAVETDPGFTLGTPTKLFEGRYIHSPSGVRNFDVSPDARRFIMVAPLESDDALAATHFNLVLNWFEELKRLVATEN